jgi:prepilin-type processing-associated H-X9-DG protein
MEPSRYPFRHNEKYNLSFVDFSIRESTGSVLAQAERAKLIKINVLRLNSP